MAWQVAFTAVIKEDEFPPYGGFAPLGVLAEGTEAEMRALFEALPANPQGRAAERIVMADLDDGRGSREDEKQVTPELVAALLGRPWAEILSAGRQRLSYLESDEGCEDVLELPPAFDPAGARARLQAMEA